MEMKKLSSGKLRAIGHDAARRSLHVQFDDGSLVQYDGVSAELYRRLAAASSMWSFFRDNIEEDFPARRLR